MATSTALFFCPLVWVLCAVATTFASEASSNGYIIRISSVIANECPDVDIPAKSKKLEILPDLTHAARFEPSDSAPVGIRIYNEINNDDTQVLDFPSCYNVRLAVKVLQQMENPELDLLVESLGLNVAMGCNSTEMQALGSNCVLSGKKTDSRSCRVCDICNYLTIVENNAKALGGTYELTDTCRSKCCKEPSGSPYFFNIKNLCLSDKDIISAAEKSGLSSYKDLLASQMGDGKIRDTLKIRAEIKDRSIPSESPLGSMLGQSYRGPVSSAMIGCFEVMANYEIYSGPIVERDDPVEDVLSSK
jgi:hypothetical protein